MVIITSQNCAEDIWQATVFFYIFWTFCLDICSNIHSSLYMELKGLGVLSQQYIMSPSKTEWRKTVLQQQHRLHHGRTDLHPLFITQGMCYTLHRSMKLHEDLYHSCVSCLQLSISLWQNPSYYGADLTTDWFSLIIYNCYSNRVLNPSCNLNYFNIAL